MYSQTMTFLFINKIYLLLAVIVVVVVRLVSKPRRTPLPPGPKGLPIVGNIKDLPPHGQPEWLHWLKLKEKYGRLHTQHKGLWVGDDSHTTGPISSVTVTGQTIVLIHDITVALGLMEKRSAEYSSRPRMVFGGEMCGWKDAVAVMPYGDRLRTARKNAYSILGTKVAVSQFQPLQEREARRTLFRILNDPSNVVQHLKTLA